MNSCFAVFDWRCCRMLLNASQWLYNGSKICGVCCSGRESWEVCVCVCVSKLKLNHWSKSWLGCRKATCVMGLWIVSAPVKNICIKWKVLCDWWLTGSKLTNFAQLVLFELNEQKVESLSKAVFMSLNWLVVFGFTFLFYWPALMWHFHIEIFNVT